jgi:hypothetical protein
MKKLIETPHNGTEKEILYVRTDGSLCIVIQVQEDSGVEVLEEV